MNTHSHVFGTIGGHATHCLHRLRQFNPTPSTVQVAVTFTLSYEDLVAALYTLLCGGIEYADLAEDATAHELVLDTLVNATAEIENAQYEIENGGLDANQAEVLAYSRDRVAQLYALPPVTPARKPRTRAKAAVR
ncbi:hypothetical protein M8C13_42310 [Crossiella sp. SN42]|uniref:hypothetical protein n=1 Tax=Crossiella sp. SN42 TaxID=2944808 RepID=UPI00207D60E3|nr:hypothetical protein [Crossiella sp. SN42]MCO1582403.1 hypothetical protein [Crossiella sp. SN42]